MYEFFSSLIICFQICKYMVSPFSHVLHLITLTHVLWAQSTVKQGANGYTYALSQHVKNLASASQMKIMPKVGTPGVMGLWMVLAGARFAMKNNLSFLCCWILS